MRTELAPGARAGRAAAVLAAALTAAALAPGVGAAEEGAGSAEGAGKPGADWESWRADNEVSDMASLQRGARNFVSYCLGCHSLKYERWSRLGQDQRSYLRDRKSTRLNSSHEWSSYAVFCLKKK